MSLQLMTNFINKNILHFSFHYKCDKNKSLKYLSLYCISSIIILNGKYKLSHGLDFCLMDFFQKKVDTKYF